MKFRNTLTLVSALGVAMTLAACESATAPTTNALHASQVASADKGKGGGDDNGGGNNNGDNNGNKGPGNAKDACKNGGFVNFTRADGTTFKNEGACNDYVEHGGVLQAAAPVITSFTGSAGDPPTNCTATITWTAVFSGGTGTLNNADGEVVPITSGVPVVTAFANGSWTLTVTNSAGVSVSRAMGFACL